MAHQDDVQIEGHTVKLSVIVFLAIEEITPLPSPRTTPSSLSGQFSLYRLTILIVFVTPTATFEQLLLSVVMHIM